MSRKNGQKQKTAARAYHRLRSIHHDVTTFVQPLLSQQVDLMNFAVFANERCGSWYYNYPSSSAIHSCHFKSTDGHVGSWLFSLKRLNRSVLEQAATCGGCIILDASVHKELPDSLSRTIPIWAAVMNRVAATYQHKLLGRHDVVGGNNSQSMILHTPPWIVPEDEHKHMLQLVDEHVEAVLTSQVIVDPHSFAKMMKRPLRPYWITPDQRVLPTIEEQETCYPIICVNCSKHYPNTPVWMEQGSFWYTPGAADDQELWARHLQPRHFWEHVDQLLMDTLTDDETDQAMDAIVAAERHLLDSEFEIAGKSATKSLFETLGTLQLSIGSRRSARPPDCWQEFDAILNVTDTEYPEMALVNDDASKYYLQLPVQEGKRDRSELERWLAVGIVFCVLHAKERRRILIHCAQGKDRSVCVAMAIVVLFCDLTYPLTWNHDLLESFSAESLASTAQERNDAREMYSLSGMTNTLVESLLGRGGRDRLLAEVCRLKGLSAATPLASKQTLRVTLHLILQDREQADPSRSNMQKLNRFFMSSEYEK